MTLRSRQIPAECYRFRTLTSTGPAIWGASVISESFNSNTLNILVGLCLPALVLGFAAPTARIVFAALWLLGMKLVAVFAAGHRHGLHRVDGAILVGLYLVFATVIACWR